MEHYEWRSNMFKFSYKLLTSRKKWVGLLVFVFSLIIASVVSIFTASNTIVSSIFQKSFHQYGEFSGVLYDLSDTSIESIKTNHKIGMFSILDTVQLKNESVKVHSGVVDENFLELGHIKFLSGNYPKSANEVAIEAYYLESIDPTWKIGELRNVQLGTINKELKLVGIIENYSANWSYGKLNFPNLFLSSSTNSETRGYLIGYNQQKSIQQNRNNIDSLINANTMNGFINDMLFYYGLKDSNNLKIISICIQLFIILLASSCIIIMLSYFNTNQIIKFTIFKTLGCTNKMFFTISTLQTLMIYLLGIAFSPPFILVFHHILTQNTYGNTVLKFNMPKLFIGILCWLIILFIGTIGSTLISLKKRNSNGISTNLTRPLNSSFFAKLKTQHFSIKLFELQLFKNCKNTILGILTLAFSILLILLSYTMSNEAEGIWDTKIDFYVSSKKNISYNVIDNHIVLEENIPTFKMDDVKELENFKGIHFIDKNPLMMDIFIMNEPTIEPDISINSDINYVLKDECYFSKNYPMMNNQMIGNSVIVYYPNVDDTTIHRLKGKEITFARAQNKKSIYSIKTWSFTIMDVINQPYTIALEDNEKVYKNGITILMNEKTALENGITNGYKDLAIYVNNDIAKDDSELIYDNVYSLIAGIPGSLFQYVPNVKRDETFITDYLEFAGKFAFCISIILTFFCINIIVLGKYRVQKKYWGIYRTLGMNSNKILVALITEALVLFFFATIISIFVYIIFLFLLSNLTYSFVYYIIFTLVTLIVMLFMLILFSFSIMKIIKKDTIASLLRVVE